jgi:hypothetical protein
VIRSISVCSLLLVVGVLGVQLLLNYSQFKLQFGFCLWACCVLLCLWRNFHLSALAVGFFGEGYGLIYCLLSNLSLKSKHPKRLSLTFSLYLV